MAAYPFVQFRTLHEIADDLVANHHCRFDQMEGGLRDATGTIHPIWYLERKVDGKLVQVAIGSDLNERPLPAYLRHLCRRLSLDPGIFGLTLG